jgi:hypothetical protein
MEQLMTQTSSALQQAATPAGVMEIVAVALDQLPLALSPSEAVKDNGHGAHHMAFLRMIWDNVVCKWAWAFESNGQRKVLGRLYLTTAQEETGNDR